MNIKEAIDLLEVIKYCEVDEIAKIKAIDMAIVALQEKEKRDYNPKLTLDDLLKLDGKCVWWDFWGGNWCMCRRGYVVLESHGTFSFDFVLAHGSAYLRKLNETT